jgi:hypothetical protein
MGGSGENRQVWIGDVPVGEFTSPFGGSEFAVMIAVFNAGPVVDKIRLARSLIDQGCRYAVCAGAGVWRLGGRVR